MVAKKKKESYYSIQDCKPMDMPSPVPRYMKWGFYEKLVDLIKFLRCF